MLHLRAIYLGLLWLLFSGNALALVAVPPLTQHVIDLTASLSAEQQNALDAKLMAFEQQKGSQLAVLIVPSTAPEEIEQYAIRVADVWKLGRKKVDDGLILLIAKEDRKIRIEVGYGLEGVVPDIIAKRVISDIIAPYFKAGNFAGGIDAGMSQLIQLVSGEALPPPAPAGSGQPDDGAFMVLLFGGVMVGWFLSALLGRTTGGLLASLGSGVLAASMLGMGFAIIIGFLVFFIVGIQQRSGGGWSNGGGFGGGGFGGSGGGGSWGGGGGGGFGGGGASGSW